MTAGPAADRNRHLPLSEREVQYSPSSCIGGNYQPYVEQYRQLSDQAREAHPPRSFRYGKGPSHTLDCYLPANPTAKPPLVVFIHGGYWQALSKHDSAFAAPGCLAQGIAFVAIDYTLAPAATLDEIVAECRAAVDWIVDHADEIGVDPERIVLAGSSAGAHLAAMTAQFSPAVKGTVLVSGLYELEPLMGTSIDQALRLEVEVCRRNSPLRLHAGHFPPTIICWGEVETDAFKEQSRLFTHYLQHKGVNITAFEVARKNHFDVILTLAEPETVLGASLFRLVSSIQAPAATQDW